MMREHFGNDADFPWKGTEDADTVSPEHKRPKREECAPEAPAVTTAWDTAAGRRQNTQGAGERPFQISMAWSRREEGPSVARHHFSFISCPINDILYLEE